MKQEFETLKSPYAFLPKCSCYNGRLFATCGFPMSFPLGRQRQFCLAVLRASSSLSDSFEWDLLRVSNFTIRHVCNAFCLSSKQPLALLPTPAPCFLHLTYESLLSSTLTAMGEQLASFLAS